MDIHRNPKNFSFAPCNGHGPYYYGGMACGYCKHCEYYIKELLVKDKQIVELQGKLLLVHNITANLNAGTSPEEGRGRIPKGNLGIRSMQPPLNLSTDSTDALYGRPGQRPGATTPVEDKSQEVSVFTVQELIDKVVENSPPGKQPVDIRAGDERCIQSLLVKLDSELKSIEEAGGM